ncbi:hypothetical protein GCM10010193_65200 [Kitasatospora atroaurantiaca]|uniref:Zn-dependent protease with chaperone function n=1 Tax=Kitasatospora atroaurantiaca TaxID=285545 RepID=A0A561EMI0_9ACTN|nr:M48 family metallopeptidase [Kitasatospora atroaurantiaca]TWE16815.1 Zn-dependent protease with chaperone function [Kitasatospora atroaurantiaca]
MPATEVATPHTCPDCAAVLDVDERFPAWCPACEWNLSTEAAPVAQRKRGEKRRQRREAARKRAVRARVEKVYESLVSDAPRRSDGAWLAAVAIAGLIHLVTLCVLAGSVALLSTGTWPLRVIGLLGLAVAFMLRPRFGRLRHDETSLRRSDAPALYGLADRVAAAVGTRPVDMIRVTDDFNAGFGRFGLRRRSVLRLGLPLWVPLTPQQRVALLGHEFGHDVNGDHRSRLWLRTALDALIEWYHLTTPDRSDAWSGGGFIGGVASLVTAPLLWVVNRLVLGVLLLLDRLTTRSGQGAEYRADGLAAEVGSTAAAKGLLEMLLLKQSAETVMMRFRTLPRTRRGPVPTDRRPAVDLWTELTEQLASLPPLERERRLRLSALDLGAVDSTHPPTHLRISMVDRLPAREPTVTVTAGESAAIEAELAAARERVVRGLLAI